MKCPFATVLFLTGIAILTEPLVGLSEESTAEALTAVGVQGGLVVHLGCGDGTQTAALRRDERFLVHGLDTDPAAIAAARDRIASLGLSGPVSVDRFDGRSLPYVDNLVNVLIADRLGAVSVDEVLRVLVPGGVALIGERKIVKPRPGEIDRWTHFLYDASGNAVARDRRVGSPQHLQWTAGPKRFRDHDALASMSAMTTTGDRVFYIVDEGPTALIHRPADWKLVARDAFNGVPLWKRDIPRWVSHLYYFRSGPAQLPRRLVTIDDRVYVTLGLDAPITALDAATGQTRMTFADSENTEEIICHEGTVLAVIGDPKLFDEEAPKVFGYWELSVHREPDTQKAIVAYDAASGETLWKKSTDNLSTLAPLSLTAYEDKVFYLDSEHLHCLRLTDGGELWRAAFPTEGLFLRNYAPTVVVSDDVALCLTWGRLRAFAADTGDELWTHEQGSIGFAAPGDLFVIDGLAWTVPQTAAIWKDNRLDRNGKIVSGVPIPTERFLGNSGRDICGIDIRTGEVRRTISQRRVLPGGHHHRCYRNKATDRYLICGRRGLEYVDLESDDFVNNWWVRGGCQYGVMPANGMIYVPPDPCQCFNLIKVDGFLAMSSGSSSAEADASREPTLETGPAYDSHRGPRSAQTQDDDIEDPSSEANVRVWQRPITPARSDEWPTYRGNITRSGSTPSPVPAQVAVRWLTQIGGELSACVVAEQKLLICAQDSCTVHALNAATGGEVWRFVTGAVIDSPPTIHDGLCVFGCRDGFVYCLRMSDGELVWRFGAAAVDRRLMDDGRLESVWPVHGSVLVLNDIVYFAAGRSSYLDGGIRLVGIDLHSGQKLCSTTVTARPVGPDTQAADPGVSVGALPDVLISDGRTINMRQLQFDTDLRHIEPSRLSTLCASTGLLEDTWFHRQNWVLAHPGRISSTGHAPGLGSQRGSRAPATGKLICFDERVAYTVSNPYSWLKRTPAMQPANQDGHFHQKYSRYAPGDFPIGVVVSALRHQPAAEVAAGKQRRTPARPTNEIWSNHHSLQIRAMMLAGDALYLAGWRDEVAIQPVTGRPRNKETLGDTPNVLLAVDPSNGETLAEYPLEERPVFDGLASAYGRIYLPLQSGTVMCLSP